MAGGVCTRGDDGPNGCSKRDLVDMELDFAIMDQRSYYADDKGDVAIIQLKKPYPKDKPITFTCLPELNVCHDLI